VVVVQEEQAVQVLVELVTNQYFQAQPQAAGLVEIIAVRLTVVLVVLVVVDMLAVLLLAVLEEQTEAMAKQKLTQVEQGREQLLKHQ
jgi:hypothetical protein